MTVRKKKVGRRSIEFRPEDKRRIAGLKKAWEATMGITLTEQDVVRFALREAAEKHGVEPGVPS